MTRYDMYQYRTRPKGSGRNHKQLVIAWYLQPHIYDMMEVEVGAARTIVRWLEQNDEIKINKTMYDKIARQSWARSPEAKALYAPKINKKEWFETVHQRSADVLAQQMDAYRWLMGFDLTLKTAKFLYWSAFSRAMRFLATGTYYMAFESMARNEPVGWL